VTLSRCDQSIAQTASLFACTLATVQDNSSNIKIANAKLDAAAAQIDACMQLNLFPTPSPQPAQTAKAS